MPYPFQSILGIKFYIGELPGLLDLCAAGNFIVVPAAPALVDLTTDAVEVHTEPWPDGYARKVTYRRGDKIAASAVAALAVAVTDILGTGSTDT